MAKMNESSGLKKNTDVLYQYRERIFYRFSQIGLLLIFPFVINNFYQGRISTGIWSALVLAIFLVDAVAIHKKKRPPIPPPIVCIPILIGIGTSIHHLGFVAGVWFYPAIILYFFMMPRMAANLVSIFSAIAITVISHHYGYDIDITSRVLVAALLTIFFINILFDVINKLHERLENAATIDELTNTFNRRYMNLSLANAIDYKKRYQTRYSVLTMDIDHFKSINDEFGHSEGDDVLRKFSDLTRTVLRKVDTIFRTGGEEFLVLLPESDINQAMKVAEKIRATTEEKLTLGEKVITVSIGVGELEADESIDSLLKRCDMALYEAKNQGRNRICQAEQSAN